jgi:hypothetical protein
MGKRLIAFFELSKRLEKGMYILVYCELWEGSEKEVPSQNPLKGVKKRVPSYLNNIKRGCLFLDYHRGERRGSCTYNYIF